MNQEKVLTFEESVKARLKDIVADLIPEERWEALVKVTIADFEKNDLPKLVKEELTKRYREAIMNELNKPEWQDKFDQGIPIGSSKIKEMLVEAAPLILAGLVNGAMSASLYNFKQQLLNRNF
jgi:hypothetical protein